MNMIDVHTRFQMICEFRAIKLDGTAMNMESYRTTFFCGRETRVPDVDVPGRPPTAHQTQVERNKMHHVPDVIGDRRLLPSAMHASGMQMCQAAQPQPIQHNRKETQMRNVSDVVGDQGLLPSAMHAYLMCQLGHGKGEKLQIITSAEIDVQTPHCNSEGGCTI